MVTISDVEGAAEKDLSILQCPIETVKSGFKVALEAYADGTVEV